MEVRDLRRAFDRAKGIALVKHWDRLMIHLVGVRLLLIHLRVLLLLMELVRVRLLLMELVRVRLLHIHLVGVRLLVHLLLVLLLRARLLRLLRALLLKLLRARLLRGIILSRCAITGESILEMDQLLSASDQAGTRTSHIRCKGELLAEKH